MRQIVFGRREDDADRLDLRDDDDAGGVAGLHVIALIDLTQADAPADRGDDAAIGYVEVGRVDLRLVAGHGGLVLRHQKLLVVDLLGGDRILFAQDLEARQIGLRLGVQGGVLGQLSLRLRQGRLIGPRIDLGQKIARFDDLAFLKANLL